MSEPSKKYKNYSLFLLMLVYTFSFLDRQIIAILAEDIKAEIMLTDTQLGILTGFAFALFYASFGIPVARLADRHHRISIISISIFLWSALTMASGYAANFIQLALARVGVGIGEAGAMPASHSVIADLFPKEKRSTALSIFQLGVPLGILIGFALGGWLSEWVGWRMTLILVGMPGIALALIVKLTVKEPKKQKTDTNKKTGIIKEVRKLLTIPTYIHLCMGSTLASMGLYMITSWTPSLMQRHYCLSTSSTGLLLALIIGVGGGIGTVIGGKWGDRALKKDKLGPFKVCSLLCLGIGLLSIFSYAMPNIYLFLSFMAPAGLLLFAWMGPHWAMVQAVSPTQSRAMASAFMLFIINLIGLGIGPVAIGLISDALSQAHFENSLSMSLMVMMPVFFWAALHYHWAGKSYLLLNKNANNN